MSNKSEIQTLNAKYESLVESLRGKAVGGGSGDASTICAVEIIADVPMPNQTINLTYANENFEFKELSLTAMDFMRGVTLRCPVNSWVVANTSVFTDTGEMSAAVARPYRGTFLMIVGSGTFMIN